MDEIFNAVNSVFMRSFQETSCYKPLSDKKKMKKYGGTVEEFVAVMLGLNFSLSEHCVYDVATKVALFDACISYHTVLQETRKALSEQKADEVPTDYDMTQKELFMDHIEPLVVCGGMTTSATVFYDACVRKIRQPVLAVFRGIFQNLPSDVETDLAVTDLAVEDDDNDAATPPLDDKDLTLIQRLAITFGPMFELAAVAADAEKKEKKRKRSPKEV